MGESSPPSYPFAVGFPSRTFVGPDVSRLAREELGALGVRRPCVITSRSVRASAAFEAWLEDFGPASPVYGVAEAHTPRGSVLDASRFFEEKGCDGLVSFGGGSAIDTAKGVALAVGGGIRTPEAFDQYRSEWQEGGRLTSFEIKGVVPPHAVIPTTLSGAAHTASAGVSNEASGRKLVHRNPALGPRLVLLDPVVTLKTPEALWTGTGMKAVEHAVEALYSRYSTPFDEPWRLRAFRILATDLVPSRDPAGPDVLERRGRLLAAAGMSVMSPPPLGISHALGHQAGAAWSIAHAHTTSIFLPVALTFNAPEASGALETMAQALGRGGEDPLGAVLAALGEMIDAFSLPRRLRDVGVRDGSRFGALAAAALRDSSMLGNPRRATEEDVIRLLEAAF